MFDSIDTGKYWDKAWSLVSGCTPCSPGCDHCWSTKMTYRFEHHDIFLPRQLTNSERQFSGRISIHPEHLDIPLKRKKPTVWAIWNDLFHEDVPFEFIEDAFEVMRHDSFGHIFLVLTKRPKRILDYWDWRQEVLLNPSVHMAWPENVWLDVTVCNQEEADEKIPLLLQIPAAVRWVSIEPMLGPIHFGLRQEWPNKPILSNNARSTIDWLVLGGETGPGARPMHPDWVRSVRDQCQAAGVPFFFKNWGARPPLKLRKLNYGRLLDGRTWNELPEVK